MGIGIVTGAAVIGIFSNLIHTDSETFERVFMDNITIFLNSNEILIDRLPFYLKKRMLKKYGV